MSLLLCQPGSGVWKITGKQPEKLNVSLEWPCVPCASPACMAVCCAKNRECLLLDRENGEEISRMPCVPGVCGMCFSGCGRYLLQLSSEADCVHARFTQTGELCYAAPAGVFPHSMNIDRTGKNLLCAGGAIGEAYLFSVPDLLIVKTIHTRHPCFAADFWRDGLLLVCATEGEDIRTVVCTLPDRSSIPRSLTELPGAPAGVCVCPDGLTAMISTRAGLAGVNLKTGVLLWIHPEWALCTRIECRENETLISDTLDGSVWIFHHQNPQERRLVARSADAQACFL